MIEKLKNYLEKPAIIHNEIVYSYRDLMSQIDIYSESLNSSRIISKTVAILGDYSFYNIALFFALYKNRNIIVPITSDLIDIQNSYLEESFCNYTIKTDKNNLIITKLDQKTIHKIASDLMGQNHSGLILFSSGSTGKPKAMIHNLDTLINSYLDKKPKSLNMLAFLMFDHIGGLNTLFNAMSIGSTLIIPTDRNAATICKLIEKYKIAVLPSSPTFLNLILISGADKTCDLGSLKMITYGTETMPASLLVRLKNHFPKVKFLQTFGTSETGISTTSSKSSDSLFMKLGDINCEYKVVEGELWLKSKTQILGYLNAPMDSFTDDGWFKSGDLVQIDGDYLKIVGRSKEIINVGGEKALPSEIESLILQMPQVADCMVYGEKNAITGQSVVCDVVLKDALENPKKAIRAFCKDKLDAFKIPTKVNVVKRTNFGDRFKKIRRK